MKLTNTGSIIPKPGAEPSFNGFYRERKLAIKVLYSEGKLAKAFPMFLSFIRYIFSIVVNPNNIFTSLMGACNGVL